MTSLAKISIGPGQKSAGFVGSRRWMETTRVLLDSWPFIILMGLLFGSSFLFYSYNTKPLYRSSSTVLIQGKKITLFTKEESGSVPIDIGELETQVEIIRSQRVAEQVLKQLNDKDRSEIFDNPQTLFSPIIARLKSIFNATPSEATKENDALSRFNDISAVQRGLSVRRPGLSFTLEISYVSADRNLAANLANAFAEAYIAEQQNSRSEIFARLRSWVDARAAELQSQAEAASAQAEAYRNERASSQSGDGSGPSLIKLRTLESKAQILQNAYDILIKQYSENAQQLIAPNADPIILNQAEPAIRPTYPKKSAMLAAGFVLGTAVGMGFILFFYYRPNTIKYIDQISTDFDFTLEVAETLYKDGLNNKFLKNSNRFDELRQFCFLVKQNAGNKIIVFIPTADTDTLRLLISKTTALLAENSPTLLIQIADSGLNEKRHSAMAEPDVDWPEARNFFNPAEENLAGINDLASINVVNLHNTPQGQDGRLGGNLNERLNALVSASSEKFELTIVVMPPVDRSRCAYFCALPDQLSVLVAKRGVTTAAAVTKTDVKHLEAFAGLRNAILVI